MREKGLSFYKDNSKGFDRWNEGGTSYGNEEKKIDG
jgi:hypothetical protein